MATISYCMCSRQQIVRLDCVPVGSCTLQLARTVYCEVANAKPTKTHHRPKASVGEAVRHERFLRLTRVRFLHREFADDRMYNPTGIKPDRKSEVVLK